MSKAKNNKTPNVKVATTTGSARAGSTPGAANATAFPLGFDSIAGLSAFGLLALTLFLAPYFFSGFWPTTYEYWPNALFLALTSCVSVLLALSPQSKCSFLFRPSAALFLLLLFLWSALSLARTVYLHDSLLELSRVGGIVACFFCARAFLNSRENFLVRASVFIGAVLAGIALSGAIGFSQYAARPDRIFATFYNPNLLANYCAMALPLAASGVLLTWRAMRQSAANKARIGLFTCLVALAIIAIALILTGSKGGFLATLCGGSVFAVAVFRAKGTRALGVLRAQKVAVAIIAILIFAGGSFLFSKTILPRLSTNIQNDHSTMFRAYTWAGTFEMAKARPLLGWGAGSFPSAYTQFAQTGYTRSAHQSWLQIAAESGFPATLFLLVACVFAFARGWKKLREKEWPIFAGSLGALTAFCVHGLVDSGWGVVSVGVLLMLVLSILDAPKESSNSEQKYSINWAFLILALPLALGSLVYQRAQNGEDLRSDSVESMRRGASDSAWEKAEDATQSDFLSARLKSNLARVREVLRWEQQVGVGGVPIYTDSIHRSVIALQPTRALNHLDYADALVANALNKEAGTQFDKAVEYDPNDPEIRLSRGKWKLEHGDSSGWKDLEFIASLSEKPYGKYPATPEIVDLNFARAYAKLATRDAQRKQFSSAQKYVQRGLQEIETAREYEPSRREMETATYGTPDEKRAQELDELEAILRELGERIAPTPTGKN